jgi:hypothetical protein
MLKAVHDIIGSSAEPIGAFNTGFDTVNLHRPTRVMAPAPAAARYNAAGDPSPPTLRVWQMLLTTSTSVF